MACPGAVEAQITLVTVAKSVTCMLERYEYGKSADYQLSTNRHIGGDNEQ
jgi:hypothetical protein